MIDDKSAPGAWAEAIKHSPNMRVEDVMTNEYQFTQDWFSWAPDVWKQLIPLLPEADPDEGRNFLEIGSFEGRSMVWIVENMMQDGDAISCIDTWSGGEEHSNGEMSGAEERFDHNAKLVMDKYPSGQGGWLRPVFKEKGTSVQMLAHRLTEEPGTYSEFDFIYIDGSHIAKDVLTDACMAWPLLKSKGIMVFDDYLWGNPRDILHRPKVAVDTFCNIFAEEIEVIHSGYQFVIRKKGE